ncbi:cell wall / vacuolar inhibitor of fructosidase 1-like [Actinidia eriantha]|uniref:cell wall / vacuolar inhibitor of fructosidase 1-like n=1 Tax=Actinidia eriantha TaxID=165200 RepID=UPI0025903222|nr:cell wall / vacuolar inhibitor of fructosidase 1-like [Actinidia eriantha]
MMSTSTTLTSFFFLLTILLPLTESSDTSQNDSIIETCKKTPYYQLCVSTLQSDPQSSKALSTQDLSLIAIEAAKAIATKILKEINKIMDLEPQLKDPLSKCKGIYESILSDHIPNAMEALDKGDHKSAEAIMSKAASGAEENQKILFGITELPIFRLAKLLFQLFVIIRKIIHLLLGNDGLGIH